MDLLAELATLAQATNATRSSGSPKHPRDAFDPAESDPSDPSDSSDDAARKRPRSAVAAAVDHTRAGQALLRSGRWEEALARFRRAAEADPTHGDAWYGLGNALFYVSGETHTEDAIHAYERAIAHGTKGRAVAHLLLGLALVAVRADHARAEEHFHRALAIEPRLAAAHMALASVLGPVHDRWTVALEHVARAASLGHAKAKAELGEFERRSQEQLGEHAPGHQWRSLRRETSESDGSSDDGDAPPVAGVASPTVPSTPGVLAEG